MENFVHARHGSSHVKLNENGQTDIATSKGVSRLRYGQYRETRTSPQNETTGSINSRASSLSAPAAPPFSRPASPPQFDARSTSFDRFGTEASAIDDTTTEISNQGAAEQPVEIDSEFETEGSESSDDEPDREKQLLVQETQPMYESQIHGQSNIYDDLDLQHEELVAHVAPYQSQLLAPVQTVAAGQQPQLADRTRQPFTRGSARQPLGLMAPPKISKPTHGPAPAVAPQPSPKLASTPQRAHQATGPRKTISPQVQHRPAQVKDLQNAHNAVEIRQSSPEVIKDDSQDYDDDELKTMTFSKLKEDHFDFDPDADPSDRFDEARDDPVKDFFAKLNTEANSDEQYRLLSMLNIEQWEAAGEWFVEQFGIVMKELSAIRREKRKIALDYETKIEERCHHVEKKRRLIDDAFARMKSSGDQVLNNTPKGKRTF